MTAGHFVFIPAVLLIGMVLGWILGSRAAADAYAAELRRREERAARNAGARRNPGPGAGGSGRSGGREERAAQSAGAGPRSTGAGPRTTSSTADVA